jgi:opacity protein-like surface antigen
MKFVTKSGLIAIVMAAVASTQAAAQAPEQRITINFTPAFATVGGDAEAALAGSVGYRFTEHLSFEGDFTWIDGADGGIRDRRFPLGGAFTVATFSGVLGRIPGQFDRITPLPPVDPRGLPNLPTTLPINLPTTLPINIGGFSASADGQTMIGTLGLRYEPTVQTARFRPYLSGGLGLNHTDQEFILEVAELTNVFDESISHSGFALSAGGGANIRLFSSLWANADAKYFRLSRDRNIMRLGGGVGFRF